MAEPAKTHSNANRDPNEPKDERRRKGSKSVSSTASVQDAVEVESKPRESNMSHDQQHCELIYDVEHLATFSVKPNFQHFSNKGSPSNDTRLLASNDTDTNAGRDTQQESLQFRSLKCTEASVSSPKAALEQLFELEKLSGIWTQRMQIELTNDLLRIVDCESNSIVEKFDHNCLTNPEAFSKFNDIYNNILVFVVNQKQTLSDACRSHDTQIEASSVGAQFGGEIYIFQCVSHDAQDLVKRIQAWKSKHRQAASNDDRHHKSMQDKLISIRPKACHSPTQPSDKRPVEPTANKLNGSSASQRDHVGVGSGASGGSGGRRAPKSASNPSSPTSNGSACKPLITVACSANPADDVPLVNVNVKETVQVFNQIAALREQRLVCGHRSLSRVPTQRITPIHNGPMRYSIAIDCLCLISGLAFRWQAIEWARFSVLARRLARCDYANQQRDTKC